jgi:hypothetical protein
MGVELAVAATIYLLAWFGLASVVAKVWRCW